MYLTSIDTFGEQRTKKGTGLLYKQIIYSISFGMVALMVMGMAMAPLQHYQSSTKLIALCRQNICFVSVGRLSSFIYSSNKFTHPTRAIWYSMAEASNQHQFIETRWRPKSLRLYTVLCIDDAPLSAYKCERSHSHITTTTAATVAAFERQRRRLCNDDDDDGDDDGECDGLTSKENISM